MNPNATASKRADAEKIGGGVPGTVFSKSMGRKIGQAVTLQLQPRMNTDKHERTGE